MTATTARPTKSSRCWAGYHVDQEDGCATVDCPCRCHRPPVQETPAGSAPEDCAALTSGHDMCPGECDGCHVHGRRSYANEAL